MQKLLFIIMSGSSQVIKNNAAVLLTHHFADIVEERYPSIESHGLEEFQTIAVRFLASDDQPEVHKCGQVMATKLLSLSLRNNREWRGFLDFTAQTFALRADALDSVLDIFCEQRVLLQHRFMVLLEPRFRTKETFLTSLLELLGNGNDHRPFIILPSISHMLTREIWSTVMKGALTSPFFETATDSQRKCEVASALRFCIQHSSFDFSSTMISKLQGIIALLMQSSHAGENRMAIKLCGALLASCFPEYMR